MKYTETVVKEICQNVFEEAHEENFKIPLTPKLIANMRSAITKAGLPATHLIIGAGVWSLIISDAAFGLILEPGTSTEDVIAGSIGSMIGLDILTDAFFAPNERILTSNFCAVASVKEDSFENVQSAYCYVE